MPTFKYEHTRFDEINTVIAKQRAKDLYNGVLNTQRDADIKEFLRRNGIELNARNIKVATDLFYFGRMSANDKRA